MTTTAIAPLSPEEVLPRWLEELQASDRAKGTIRRYRSAVEGFLSWYFREEQQPLTFSTLTPIALVGYRNYAQRAQHRATSTVNGQISALRAFCAWLTCLIAALLGNCDGTEAGARWWCDHGALLRGVFGPRLFLLPSGSLVVPSTRCSGPGAGTWPLGSSDDGGSLRRSSGIGWQNTAGSPIR